ncbi:autotransporter domain-containing protein [Bordetella sp. 02P26C-1]|uniref:autotransporter domain-containing protein n=1 Tax=Bordetella sp. 02P26C-1 TaxID=2683195 RepID=UPI00135419A9|nr:autotransporter domain-containing protein [Bordetella sp. 02P26C-1]
MFGSVGLNGGTMINDGLYVPGATFNGQLLNRGRVLLGGVEADVPGVARSQYTATTHTGSLTQTSDGMLQLGADFNTQQFDAIHASGDVHLDGELTVLSRALLSRRELAIVTSDSGTPTGTLTPLDTLLFDYATRNAGNATRLFVARANFNAEDMQLRGNQKRVAGHLQEGWDAGGSPALATFYATLDTIARAGAATYQQRMSDLSPGVTLVPGAQSQLAMGRFTRAMMSCPTWTDTNAPYKEQSCVWGDVSRRSTNQDGYSTVSGYSYDTVTYQFGGQREIAPHWFLGGSVAYQTAQVRGDDSRVKGDGDAGYAGLVLKREDGPRTYSAALSAGYGSFDMDRSLSIPNYEERARSHPDVVTVGTRLRAARTFTNGKLYVKPFVDLTGQYARVPGYQESGDALSLDVQSSEQFVLGLEPAFEVGARMELPKGIVLRPFAYAGLLLSSVDGWTTQASLDGAPNGSGTFQTTMPMDSVVRRVGLGLQMLSGKGASMRVQYDGEFSSSAKSHAGSLKLAVPF